MTETLINSILAAVFGGGVVLGVITLIRFRKRDNAVTGKTETEYFKEIKAVAQEAVAERFAKEREIIKLDQSLRNSEHLVSINEGIIKRLESQQAQILINQGVAEERSRQSDEREHRCQQELAEVKKRLSALEIGSTDNSALSINSP